MKPKSTFAGVEISEIRKMNALAGRNTFNLGIGQLPDKLPQAVKVRGIEAFEQGRTRYTSNQGSEDLRSLVAAYHTEKNGRKYNADQVIITNGAEGALWNIFTVYLEQGDEVLIPEIAFSVYKTIAELQGSRAVTYSLKKDFSIDLTDLERKISDKTRFIVINSPNNPTGSVLSEEQIMALTEIAEGKGLYIISDEIYSELYFSDNRPVSPMAYSERVITVDGISKRAAATGLRIGWTIAPEEITKPMVVANQYVTTCASSISQDAAIASLDGSADDFIKQIREDLVEKGNYAWNTLRKIKGLQVVKPQGAFYIFPDISEFGTSREVALRILDEVDVLTIPGIAFGERGKNHIRLSYAADFEVLKEALERIKHLFRNWH